MTGFWRGEEEEIVHLKLTPTVWESSQVEWVDKAAAKLNTQARVHLKVDTGMGRLGVGLDSLQAVCATVKSSSHVVCRRVCPRIWHPQKFLMPHRSKNKSRTSRVRVGLYRSRIESKVHSRGQHRSRDRPS